MKLFIEKNKLNVSPAALLRQAGYVFLVDRHEGHDSYVRHLTSGYYPRFHIYYDEDQNNIIINLHLDQKKPSYPGAHAHNAEYDGDLVEREINRLKSLV